MTRGNENVPVFLQCDQIRSHDIVLVAERVTDIELSIHSPD